MEWSGDRARMGIFVCRMGGGWHSIVPPVAAEIAGGRKAGGLPVNGGRMRFTAAPLRNRERSVRAPCRPLLGRIPT